MRRHGVAACRAAQTEMFAERAPFVVGAEEAATAQLRQHRLDEIVESAWQKWRHEIEAVAAVLLEPFLHLIGDPLRRAPHDRLAARSGNAKRRLPEREI